MVNADLLDAMDRSLRQARQKPHEAFGGVQLVLFGDPYQLAPVPGDPEERAYFADRYESMWFFDARVWDEADLIDLRARHDPPPARARVQAAAHRRAPRRGHARDGAAAQPGRPAHAARRGRDHPRHHQRTVTRINAHARSPGCPAARSAPWPRSTASSAGARSPPTSGSS